MTRTVIVGGPKTGKTTLAVRMGGEVIHTDIFALGGADFSAQSEAAATLLGREGDWTMEGVTAVRALRKWMEENPGKPCDDVICLSVPHENLSPGQRSLGRGCDTVFLEILPELRRRGVEISGSAIK